MYDCHAMLSKKLLFASGPGCNVINVLEMRKYCRSVLVHEHHYLDVKSSFCSFFKPHNIFHQFDGFLCPQSYYFVIVFQVETARGPRSKVLKVTILSLN
jgi:hypothetical protein